MAEPTKIGRMYRGQRHAPSTTAEAITEVLALQSEYDHPDAMPIEAYFSLREVKDPVKVAGMLAYTKVRRATVSAWDKIFSSF